MKLNTKLRLSNLFDFFKDVKIVLKDTPLHPVSTQEDPRVHESIKRTRAAFKQQEQQMSGRALKPHSVSCKDPVTCMKTKCFKWEPDKIVSGSEKVLETAEQVQARMSKKKGIFKF